MLSSVSSTLLLYLPTTAPFERFTALSQILESLSNGSLLFLRFPNPFRAVRSFFSDPLIPFQGLVLLSRILKCLSKSLLHYLRISGPFRKVSPALTESEKEERTLRRGLENLRLRSQPDWGM